MNSTGDFHNPHSLECPYLYRRRQPNCRRVACQQYRQAFETQSALLFRGQNFDDETHLKLAKLFGPLENRDAMVYWCLIVIGATIVAMLPLFLGMFLVFPVLGHASWHVYRKTVDIKD